MNMISNTLPVVCYFWQGIRIKIDNCIAICAIFVQTTLLAANNTVCFNNHNVYF